MDFQDEKVVAAGDGLKFSDCICKANLSYFNSDNKESIHKPYGEIYPSTIKKMEHTIYLDFIIIIIFKGKGTAILINQNIIFFLRKRDSFTDKPKRLEMENRGSIEGRE